MGWELSSSVLELFLTAYVVVVMAASLVAIYGTRIPPKLPLVSGLGSQKVSIIVPVMNEEDTIRESLDSLLGLHYQDKEIIVVSGDCTDGTQTILREYNGKIQIIPEPEKPEGWLGKSWACYQGFLESSGEVLMFTDGDVIHDENSLSTALAYMNLNGLDLLSPWPRVVTRTISERMILPIWAMINAIMLAVFGTYKTNTGRAIKGANGQYILVKREAYKSAGGHEGVKGSLFEDGPLGERIHGKGYRVANVDGGKLSSVKPYSNSGELRQALRRSAAGLFPNLSYFAAGIIFVFFYFLFPIILIALGVELTSNEVLLTGIVSSTVMFAAVIAFCVKQSRVWYFILAPLSALILIAEYASGYVKYRGSGVYWKGKAYSTMKLTAAKGNPKP